LSLKNIRQLQRYLEKEFLIHRIQRF
jgi:hypothetical protein